jgi:hypothetical protein
MYVSSSSQVKRKRKDGVLDAVKLSPVSPDLQTEVIKSNANPVFQVCQLN